MEYENIGMGWDGMGRVRHTCKHEEAVPVVNSHPLHHIPHHQHQELTEIYPHLMTCYLVKRNQNAHQI